MRTFDGVEGVADNHLREASHRTRCSENIE
jgi:hypothetical protein